MEVIKNLLNRFRQSGILLLIGIFLIIYIAFGFVYWQQSSQQRELQNEIARLSLVVSKPLPGAEKLHADYDEANSALAPIARSAIIATLVDIAEESGIDVDPDSDKFKIPAPGKPTKQKVGGGSYQVLSFNNISVQGDYDNVMDFIDALESGETLKTMVLKRVKIEQTETETTVTLDIDLYSKPGG